VKAIAVFENNRRNDDGKESEHGRAECRLRVL
jgi:hypothetical protein